MGDGSLIGGGWEFNRWGRGVGEFNRWGRGVQ